MSGWAMANCYKKPSCQDLGYIAGLGDCTNGDARKLRCPFGSGYFCKSPDNGTNCVLGSTLYDDLKCYASSEVPAGRVPIGKVTNPFKTLAMALDETELPYGAVGVSREIFPYGATDKEKTKLLVEEVGDSSDYAAGYCYNYKTKGTNKGDWFLSYNMFAESRDLGPTWKGFTWITGIDGSRKKYWGIDMVSSTEAFIGDGEGGGVSEDKTELHSVRCLINYTDVVVLTPKTCKVGDVLYSDLKCYDETPSGLTAIAVVFDTENRLAISKEERLLYWGEDVMVAGCGVLNPMDCTLDGKELTKKVVDGYGNSSDYAAGYCYNYTTEGTKKGDWFLPNIKELYELYKVKGVIGLAPSKPSIMGYQAWSSIVTDDDDAYALDMDRGRYFYTAKRGRHYVYCAIKF